MNEEAINYVMRRMSTCLDNGQMIRLQKALEESLCNEEGVTEISSAELLERFLATKRLEGRSEKTLSLKSFQYRKAAGKVRKERMRHERRRCTGLPVKI